MLRGLFRLLTILLVINNSYSNSKDSTILFVGHAYGSHFDDDSKLDPVLLNFINTNNKILFDKIIFGGDFIYNCNDVTEIKNFKNSVSTFDYRFVIGNHENCDKILEISKVNFGDFNYYEKQNDNLLIYLNTSSNYSKDKVKDMFDYIKNLIEKENPNNVVLFTHQVIFSKNDFYLRVNSRKFYDFGNNLYQMLYDDFNGIDTKFHFFSGDIGAFNYTPFAFFDNYDNFYLYAVGIGNKNNSKAILVNLGKDISVDFIDINNSKIESKENYTSLKVQLYQLPKLLLFHIKSNIYIFAFLILGLFYMYFKNSKFYVKKI